MSNDFSQFRVGEPQLSAVKSAVSPVETPQALGLSAFASAAQTLGQFGFAYVEKEREQERLEADAAAAAQEDMFDKQYFNVLQETSDLLSSGRKSTDRARAKTNLRLAEKRLIAEGYSTERMMKARKQFEGLSIGTILKTEEESFSKLRQADLDAAQDMGFIHSRMSEQEREDALLSYYRFVQVDNERQLEEDRYNHEKLKAGADSAKLDLIEKQRKQSAMSNLAKMNVEGFDSAKVQIQSVLESLKTGASRQDVETQLRLIKDRYTERAYEKGFGAPVANIDAILKPVHDLVDTAIDRIDSTNLVREVEDEIALNKARTQLAVINDNPKAVKFGAYSSLLGPNVVFDAAAIPMSTQFMSDLMDDDKKIPDVTSGNEEANFNFSALKDSYSRSANPESLHPVNNEELISHTDRTLQSIGKYLSDEDSPNSVEPTLNFLADPKFGQFFKEHKNLFDDKTVSAVGDILRKSAQKQIYPSLHNKLADVVVFPEEAREVKSGRSTFTVGGEEVPTEVRGSGQSKRAATRTSKTTEDKMDIELIGNTLQFVGSDKASSNVADELNKQFGEVLTTYFKAVVNITGSSAEKVFQLQLPNLWPSKYGNGTFLDEDTGEEVTFENGKRL